MQRAKQINNNFISYSINEEPIVLSKAVLDILLKETNSANLIALYCFYYYTAKWQKTNQPKATIEYVSQGLRWTADRVRKAKRQLKELELIEDTVVKDSHNKITGHYIRVNFIWSKNHPYISPSSGLFQRMEHNEVNALSANKENALNTNNKDISLRAKKYFPLAEYLSKIIKSTKNICHTKQQLTIWSNSIRQLVENNKVSHERIEKALFWYEKNVGGQYIPVIESGSSLKDKFLKLEAAMERENYSDPKKPDKIMEYGRWWYLKKDGSYYDKEGVLFM